MTVRNPEVFSAMRQSFDPAKAADYPPNIQAIVIRGVETGQVPASGNSSGVGPAGQGALVQKVINAAYTAFHDGLRRLRDAKTLKLLPFTAAPAEMNLPEYALLEGATFLYFATR